MPVRFRHGKTITDAGTHSWNTARFPMTQPPISWRSVRPSEPTAGDTAPGPRKPHLRSEHLQGTQLAAAQADRLRLGLAKIAARVCLSARRVAFHLSSNCPYQSLFRAAAASLLLDNG